MLLAVYGTLRKGDHNDGFLDGYQPVATERVEGFEMFHFGGSYPYIARGADDITVEVYDVPPEVVVPIERMERGAGYDMGKAKTSLGLADIFVMTEERHSEMQARTNTRPPKIISGDWFDWLRRYQPYRLPREVNVTEGDGDAI